MGKNKPIAFSQLALGIAFLTQNTVACLAQEGALILPEVQVKGQRKPAYEVGGVSAGAATEVTPDEIRQVRPLSTDDVLRGVPGIHVVAEDGRGLRPNIGFRGLNPERSRKTLLLMDGIPFQPAVYGDPAAYFNVPVELIESIDVIRGASSVLYGPNTVGGVINYRLRRPRQRELTFTETVRQGELFSTQFTYGNAFRHLGFLATAYNKTGRTVRDNTDTEINGLDLLLDVAMDRGGSLRFGLHGYREIAQTPGGLSVAQFLADPNSSQRSHDEFEGNRAAFDIRWSQPVGDGTALETLFYSNWFERNWFIADGVDAANPTTNSQFLRDFFVIGLEPRLRVRHNWGAWTAGVRTHYERMQDLQRRGAAVDARSGVTRQEATNETTALSAYTELDYRVTDRLFLRPGLRYEYIDQTIRIGLRNGLPSGVSGSATTAELIGGIGASYELNPDTVLFANAFRTFSPPQFSQAVDPTTGTDNDLNAEKALNLEIGARGRFTERVKGEVALFRIAFDNQIVSEAGKLVNAQDTLHEGLEGALKARLWHGFSADASFTLLRTEFRSGANAGNELPSAPKVKGAAGANWESGPYFVRVEAWHVGRQFSDAANTVAESPDGAKGQIPAYTVFNLRSEYRGDGWTVFAGVENLFDKVY